VTNAITVFENSRPQQTREEWLIEVVDALRINFVAAGHPLPERLGVTCGWPSSGGLRRSTRTVGECWSARASADGTTEIFISPYLGDGLGAAETLIHELVHAAGMMGHGREFSRLATAIGLSRPWRTTTATSILRERLNAIVSGIGPYPHASLIPDGQSQDDPEQRPAGPGQEEENLCRPHRKDKARLLKVFCPKAECHGYKVRITATWLAVGFPTCPCGTRMVR
jgi:hypothetical protein